MDVALVEHAQHDVHADQRGQDQDGLGGQRSLEGLGGALEAGPDRRRHVDVALGRLDRRHRLAQGHAGGQVERQCHRGEEALVVHRQRRRGRLEMRDGAQRHLLASGGLHVDRLQVVGILLEARQHLQHDVVLVQGAEDRRDLALAEGAVERLVDGLRQHTQARGAVAVDDEGGLQATVLLVGRRGVGH